MKVKKYLSVITAVVMMLVFTGLFCLDAGKNISMVQTYAADMVSSGDVNLDGTVDTQDLIQLKKLFGGDDAKKCICNLKIAYSLKKMCKLITP